MISALPTTIAKKLSHVLYSKLLQDCFAELTFPVIHSKARIYQYVGDEAVITWSKKDGFTNYNCIKMYFEFNRQLQKKKGISFPVMAFFLNLKLL